MSKGMMSRQRGGVTVFPEANQTRKSKKIRQLSFKKTSPLKLNNKPKTTRNILIFFIYFLFCLYFIENYLCLNISFTGYFLSFYNPKRREMEDSFSLVQGMSVNATILSHQEDTR